MTTRTRRRFLKESLGGVIATASVPLVPTLAAARPVPLGELRSAARGAGPQDEAFWRLVRDQFPVRRDLVLMNAANLCPSPYPVIDAVTGLTRDIDRDASFQNRSRFRDLREATRAAVARHVGADPDEIAIVRNTSEGNNTVVSGLELGRGDEVVIWDQNHPTNNVAWDVRAERYGFTVRRVTTPAAPESAAELVAPFEAALGPRTRVLAFSHVSNVSGVALPAAELCRLAAERGVLTLVDGAQVMGALRLDLHAMGCDFYTASAHKWPTGPKEVGVLYVRRGRAESLWPLGVGVGWNGARDAGALRFETLGQRDDAAIAALGAAMEFHAALGADVIEARVRTLAAAVKQAVRDAVPGTRFHAPDGLDAGVIVFALPGRDARPTYEALYRDHGIAGAAMGGAFEGVRLSPHIYNTLADVERVGAALSA